MVHEKISIDSKDTYILNGTLFDPNTNEGQSLLHQAYIDKRRPLCICKNPSPEMYIANVKGNFVVKRMPSTGAEHSLDCASFIPPDELSGLGQIQGSAIEECPDEGTTHLKIDFPLSISGKRVAPPPASDDGPTEAKAAPKKLTLTSLLHYLWYEADLVKWVPKMEGKRWWGTVHKTIIDASDNKIAKKQDLSSKLFIPEAYKIDDKVGITARRNIKFQQIKQTTTGGTPLGILVAEYKKHDATALGAKFLFKHMPDCPFFADQDLIKKFNRVFESKLQLAFMMPDVHIIIIATFSFAKAGYPVLHEMGMMLTSKNWIPFENTRDLSVIDAATEQKRWFNKSMRFNLSKSAPIASMVMTDIDPPVALFISPPSADGDAITQMMTTADESTYDAWLWLNEEDPMPNLPIN